MGRYGVTVFLLSGIGAFAQFSGRVSGTVLDSSGAPVANAVVNLYLAGGARPPLSTTTARDGTWHFIGVRSTDYDAGVEAAEFAKFSLRGVTVDPASETDVPAITLNPVGCVIQRVVADVVVMNIDAIQRHVESSDVWSGDQNINSTSFGAVASMLNSPRIMQFGVKYRF